MSLTILSAIADPNVFQLLPVIAAFLNREPRPCHKVHAFQSQPHPEMIKPYALNGSTGDKRLKIFGFHFENVTPIQWDPGRLQPCADLARSSITRNEILACMR